tara:strand:+ start:6363 stop:7178 length:816 start_codon:yes stop_codon:yes gene_type:complete
MSDSISRLRLLLRELADISDLTHTPNNTYNIYNYENYIHMPGASITINNADSNENNYENAARGDDTEDYSSTTEISATISIPAQLNNTNSPSNENSNSNNYTNSNNLYDNSTNINNNRSNSNPPLSNTAISGNNRPRQAFAQIIPLVNNSDISDTLRTNINDIVSNLSSLTQDVNISDIVTSDNVLNIVGRSIQPQEPVRQTSVPLSILNEKTNVFITEEKTEKCSICNETYEEDPICRRNIGCNHYFHRGCIDTWYSEHTKCPICNQEFS